MNRQSMRQTAHYIFLMLTLWGLSAGFCQAETLEQEQPRIGLVLGGGGARGFAHLGVLQELEKRNIPIACIAGTSAGALIGGAYASGMPLDELQKLLDDTDWDALLAGSPARSNVPFDRKRNDYKNYVDMAMGVRDGKVVTPRGAINSQQIDMFIHRMVRDTRVESFDELPIPFRAVSTDLLTGDAVVFDKGELALAMRASMAVPGLFDLVEYHDRLLVDGMLARNVPVQDIKGRCADRVIVVDVGEPMKTSDEIKTLFDVLGQTTNIAVNRNIAAQMALLGPEDIVIRPDLTKFSSADFDKYAQIRDQGRKAVAPVASQLAVLGVPTEDYQRWQARLKQPPQPVFDRVEVVESSGYVNEKPLVGTFQSESGQTTAMSMDDVQQRIDKAFASGNYERIGYRVASEDGRSVATVMPVEKNFGPNYLRFGLSLQGSRPGDSTFALLGMYERVWLNSAGGTWRNEVRLGADPHFKTELYQPLSVTSPFFVAGSYLYDSTRYPVFAPQHRHLADVELNTSRFELGAGLSLGSYGEARVGAFALSMRSKVITGELPPRLMPAAGDYDLYGGYGSIVLDQFDNPRWPRKGYYVNAIVQSAVNNDDAASRYATVSSVAEYANTVGEMTFRLTGKYRGNLNNTDTVLSPQALGGFLNLSGYEQNELIGDRVALARMMAYWRVATLPSALGSGVYAGASFEVGKVWNELWSSENTSWLPAGTLFLGADSLIGPLFLGVGTAKGGRLTGYMYLGVDY